MYEIWPVPETRDERARLLNQTECQIYELAVSEPSGKSAVRTELIQRSSEFVDFLRSQVLPPRKARTQ